MYLDSVILLGSSYEGQARAMKAANPSSSSMAVDLEFLQNHLARDIVKFFHFSLDFGHMMDLDLKWSKMVSDWTSFDTT